MAPDFQNPGTSGAQALKPAAASEELKASDLRARVPLDPSDLVRAYESLDAADLLGQQRALDAIRLAIGIDAPGYNVFISGLRTRNERESALRLLDEKATTMPTPGDWVYVNNFRSPEAPVAIYLKAGQGRELSQKMNQLVSYVIEQLPKAFRREDFDRERTALRDKYNRRAQEMFGGLEARARERGFAIQGSPTGQVIFIPLINERMPESPEALQAHMNTLSDQERARLAETQGELQDELAKLVMRQQEVMRELVADIRAIERSFAARLITPAIEDITRRFNTPGVTEYLDQVADHMLSHLDRFREAAEPRAGEEMRLGMGEESRWSEYQ